MLRLRQLLDSGVFITDGAMGTYYSQLTGKKAKSCEKATLTNPDLIRSIHRSYLRAGARLLRTNTFAANTKACGLSLDEVLEICRLAWNAAADEAGGSAAVLADIGPISGEDAEAEYLSIIDCFLACGARDFSFETFSEPHDVILCAKYIKKKFPDAAVAGCFTFSPDGRTRTGHSVRNVLAAISETPEIDIFGFNCGCGPTHMRKIMQSALPFDRPVIAMPNAGYPSVEEQRTIFSSTPDFFAEATAELVMDGVAAVGGCCGTTPEHIKKLAEAISLRGGKNAEVRQGAADNQTADAQQTRFVQRLKKGEFLIAAELDPPHGSDLAKIINAAHMLQNAGVDIITISDSPMARVKLDPVICSARIQRETGIDVLPHLCCRDRNINALRALLFGAHSEGIRSVLAVTGDPVPESTRGVIKPVFNIGSIKLMDMIHAMNDSDFCGDPVTFGAALNPFVYNPSVELERVCKKIRSGAEFFLCQPVFDDSCGEFLQKVREEGAKVFVGILPIVSRRNAEYMDSEVPGIRIPEELKNLFDNSMSREEAQEIGIRIAVEIAQKIRQFADGFYFITPFNRAEMVCEILKILKGKKTI